VGNVADGTDEDLSSPAPLATPKGESRVRKCASATMANCRPGPALAVAGRSEVVNRPAVGRIKPTVPKSRM
jgi:hypothetical protein